MVANATDFSTDHERAKDQSPGRDSNPRPAAYKAAALPLSYPGGPPQATRRTLATLRQLVSTFRPSASTFSALRTFDPRFQLKASQNRLAGTHLTLQRV